MGASDSNNPQEKDYVLGTHDAELERLGLQHRVWRPKVLDAWQRAGITAGKTVIDLGSGPGYATLDLAEMVGPTGRVVALERSGRFIQTLKARAEQRKFENITVIEGDVVTDHFPEKIQALPELKAVAKSACPDLVGADFSWTRWVLCFVSSPETVIRKLHASLKPGGVSIFHEYVNYESWKMLPQTPQMEFFINATVSSWRKSGGEPDIGQQLPGLLTRNGYEILEIRPLVYAVSPNHEMWQWPISFINTHFDRLVELGEITEAEARQIQPALLKAAESGQHYFLLPTVLEVIARKVCG